MVMLVMVMMPARESVAFTSAGDSVSLQVQLMVASGGSLINGTKDVVVRLIHPVTTGQAVMWEKTHEGVVISEGVLRLELTGEDSQGHSLIADMFDKAGVQMEVEIEGEVVGLDMMSQPYAIKSRISDEAQSTRGLQGVPVREVTEVNDGDILVARDGEWVPTSEWDGYSGSSRGLSEGRVLEDLGDVNLEGLNEGEILGYDGNRWVNVSDQKLSEADVDAIVSEKGYLKEIGTSELQEGEYDQIKGIGGVIKTSPYIQVKQCGDCGRGLEYGGECRE